MNGNIQHFRYIQNHFQGKRLVTIRCFDFGKVTDADTNHIRQLFLRKSSELTVFFNWLSYALILF